ncbi:MAG TPA: hypothetical protein VLZ81_01970 [Blastocatellia bacterium]|nr:hypothetical protein [Blastocatellia bacterium]
MDYKNPPMVVKLAWSLPWLARYPFWRGRQSVTRAFSGDRRRSRNLIFTVANHFEPAWSASRVPLPIQQQLARVKSWRLKARRAGNLIRDFDNVPFRHTNFYPAEQYDRDLLDLLADLQSEGFGEVEVHLHHGVGRPDTAENLRATLLDFTNILAERHGCLSRTTGDKTPRYAFVHGNYALSNSAGGRYCGVDDEMRILAETGCYIDMTLPSAPDRSQVSRINAVYEYGGDPNKRRAHERGRSVGVGRTPSLPVIMTGPLVFDWRSRRYGLPYPRLDCGVLASSYRLDMERVRNWISAGVSVQGRPEWVFIKLHCHGFFPQDQDYTIGEPIVRFFDDLLDHAQRTGEFKVHFATAREAFNMVMAAAADEAGEPGDFRNYLLSPVMGATATEPGILRQELTEKIAG